MLVRITAERGLQLAPVTLLHTISYLNTTTTELHTMVNSMKSSLMIHTQMIVKVLSTPTLTMVRKVISTYNSRRNSKNLSGPPAWSCSLMKRISQQEKQLARRMLATKWLTLDTIIRIVQCFHILLRILVIQVQHRITRRLWLPGSSRQSTQVLMYWKAQHCDFKPSIYTRWEQESMY